MGEGAQGAYRRGHEEPRHLTDQLVAAVLLGFVLGLQHAMDPDHLVAVATIVTRERRFADGALVGVLWGLGHTATLVLAGTAIVAFRLTLGAGLVSGLELAVAAMLVLLGALRLRDAARGVVAVPPEENAPASADVGLPERLPILVGVAALCSDLVVPLDAPEHELCPLLNAVLGVRRRHVA